MSNIPVYHYVGIPSFEFCLPVDQYEDYIKQEPEIHGVKWVYKLCYPPKVTVEMRRNLDCPWTTTMNDTVLGLQERKLVESKELPFPEDLQKASKKVGCKARLSISFRPDEKKVYMNYVGIHENHIIGSLDGLRYFPLSFALKNEVELRLREEYDKRDIRISIQSYLSCEITSSIHSDQLLHSYEI
ncbi:MAG: hypothetical protein EXX96DRAFT_223536 [Benjaminiella poitrasii]|nr:MAG: hypothetical protein EXX96DRAFT_223536 [Benjaminiella poitrasii]